MAQATSTSTSTSIRIQGRALAGALRAAAAFVDADKKSHRHRINLRAITIRRDDSSADEGFTELRRLFVAGGNPLSAIVVDAGDIDGLDDFDVDIAPAAAAVIVRLFGGNDSSGLALTIVKDALRIDSVDRLFDNQRIEVRTRKSVPTADNFAVVRRALWSIRALDAEQRIEGNLDGITPTQLARVAAASKVMSGSVVRTGYYAVNDSRTAVIQFDRAIAVCASPLRGDTTEGWRTWLDADQSDIPWISSLDIRLQHILDSALPKQAAAAAETGEQPSDDVIDLDDATTQADAEAEVAA